MKIYFLPAGGFGNNTTYSPFRFLPEPPLARPRRSGRTRSGASRGGGRGGRRARRVVTKGSDQRPDGKITARRLRRRNASLEIAAQLAGAGAVGEHVARAVRAHQRGNVALEDGGLLGRREVGGVAGMLGGQTGDQEGDLGGLCIALEPDKGGGGIGLKRLGGRQEGLAAGGSGEGEVAAR